MTWTDLIKHGCPNCGCEYDHLHVDTRVVCRYCGWSVLESDVRGWLYGIEECRICGYRGAFVAPGICDLDYMECANCGNMSCEVV